MSMADNDMDALHTEEQELQFSQFDTDIAWMIGSDLRARALRQKLPTVIEISLAGKPLLFAALPGATPDNAEWIRRKRKVVAASIAARFTLRPRSISSAVRSSIAMGCASKTLRRKAAAYRSC
ncbi:heme-binding protein (plasmid) [Nitrobacteraceae bacterium UC4446_H13]